MKLKLERIAKRDDYTIGKLYINGVYFCDTLEDKDRELDQSMTPDEIKKIKVQHQTAIPTGEYKIILNISPRFQRLLPRLQRVPGFVGILIHRGNSSTNTSGCILVGKNTVVGKVTDSTNYENKLVERLKQATDEITIKIS